MNPIWMYLAVFIWFALGSLIAWWSRKGLGEGMAEYFLANRRIGGVVGAFTLSATLYSAFMMVGLVGLVYAIGVGSFGFEMTYLASTVVLLAIFMPRFWVAGKKYGFITPSELLGSRYENRAVAVIVAILMFILVVPLIATSIMGSGYLMEGLTNGAIPYWQGGLIILIVAFVYAWWAGMRSVVFTDALQGVLMLGASLTLLIFVVYQFFGSPAGFISTVETAYPQKLQFTWDIHIWLGLCIPWIFCMILYPHTNQRFFILKNVNAMRGTIIGFGIFGLLYTLMVCFFGLAIPHIAPGLENPDTAMPILLSKVPVALALFFVVGILAASVSTMNSLALSVSSIVGRDIYRVASPGISEQKELFWSKLLIPLLLIICYIFAMAKLGLIAILTTMTAGGLMSILPTLVGAFFWKRGTATAAIWSIVISAIVILTFYFTGIKPLGWWPPVWGLLVSTVLFIVISLFTKPPKKAAEFVDYTNNWRANAKALKE